jgi:hypothetical protein
MDRAIARAVTEKKPVPEIDFTLHTMEDNTQVSTMERVVKGSNPCDLNRFRKIVVTLIIDIFYCQRSKRPP